MQTVTRVIAHLDMDAFYASVELLRRPELRGLPVVIGGRGDPARSRGVVTTASYEARRYGVRSAMPLKVAVRLCPDAIFLPTDFDEYKRLSRMFKKAIGEIAPQVEDRGIDEVYIDLTDVAGVADEGGAALAREIKHNVYTATGLSCSVGIAPNKLLAKMASELDKPDGLTLITAADISRRIWPLAVSKINGIGPKATARLQALGIDTIGELAVASPEMLIGRFGNSFGAWMHEAAHGRDDRPIVTDSEPRSMSRETTFQRDLDPRSDLAQIQQVIIEQAEEVASDLARRHYVARTIGIKLRFDDFRTLTRAYTLQVATHDVAQITSAALECLARVPLERKVRLLGVRANALSAAGVAPATLACDLFGLR